MKKRIISILLVAVMVVAMIPATLITAFAEGESGRVMDYASIATLDGKNTLGEYDGATKVYLNAYGNDTDGDNMRVIYTKDAIYVLVEVFDSTVADRTEAGSNTDFVFLGFSVGSSFQGIKRIYRSANGSGRLVFQPEGTYVDMAAGLSATNGSVLEKYFAHNNNKESGFTLEAKFPASEMSPADYAAFKRGELEVRFTAGTQDGIKNADGTFATVATDGDIENAGWDGAAEEDYFVPSNNTGYKAKNVHNFTPYTFEFQNNSVGYHVAYTDTPITADGVIDDAYLNSTKIPISNVVKGSDTGTEAYAYAAYDDKNLYIAVYVKDSTNDGSSDKVNFMLDWLYDEDLFEAGKAKHGTSTNSTYKNAAYYTKPSLYLGHMDVTRTGSKSGAWMFNSGATPYTAQVAATDDGYIVEARFVWEGNVKNALLAETFDFGVSLIVFDGSTQYSNGVDAYDTGFRYNMFPKATITKTSESKNSIAFVDTAIEADGVIDDVYFLGNKIEINNLVAGAEKGTSGYAYMAYDQNYLYIAVYVNDSTNDGASDYVALTLDWLYDEELFATGASNYKKEANWTAPNYYLGYAQIGRDHENTSTTWHAWMFDSAKILPTKRSAAAGSGYDYTVEYKIPWMGNAKTELLSADTFDFGAGIVIYDKGTEVANGNQSNSVNKAFTGEMLPKYTAKGIAGFSAEHADEVIYENSGVDGVIEDSYLAGTKVPVNNIVAGDHNNTTSGTAYVTYDEKNIYLAIDVKDSTNNGTSDYVALAIDLLYDAELFKTGAANYKTSANYSDPNFYLGYIELRRDGSAASNSWMFGSGLGYSRKQVATDGGYIVEFRIELRGNARADFFNSDIFEFGLGITIFDNGTQISNGTQNNDKNKAFNADMLPKFAIDYEGTVINRADGSISVDGVMDDAYLSGTRYDIGTLVSGTATTAGDSYAYVVYDDTGLYVYVYSTDTTNDATNDRIHFYLDWKYDINEFNKGASSYKASAAWTKGTAYLGYYESSRSGGASRNWMFSTSVVGLNASYKAQTANGFSAEYKLTWSEMGLEKYQSAEDFELGIAIHIVDGSTHYSNSTINTKDQTQALNNAMYPKFVIKKGTTTDSNDIAYANDGITLDGEIDAAYLNSTPVQLNYYQGGDGTTGNSLGTSKAYMTYTDDALYLIVDMKDKTVFKNGYTGKASDGNVHEGVEVLVDFFRATATAEQMALTGATYKDTAKGAMGYLRSSYKHNTDTNTYTVNNWENYWMWGQVANIPKNVVKVVDGGYRIEYKINFTDDIKNKIASMSVGESVEIGLGIRMRDDNTDDGVINRYNVFGSCPTLDPGGNPKAVYSYTLTKGEAKPSEMTGANITLGKDLSVNYYVDVAEGSELPKMLFEMNGRKIVLPTEYDRANNEWKVSFDGIAPQNMGDNISAKLIVDGKFVDVKEEYSVKENVLNIKNDANAQLVYDLLAYGAASQIYTGYKTDALVNAGYEDLATKVDSIANTDKVVGDALENAKFVAGGVYHADTNKLYAKVAITNTNDISGVVVTINGVIATIEKTGAEGVYIVYTEELSVMDFDKVFTFVLYDGTAAADGTKSTQTLTYSVNAYAKAKLENYDAEAARDLAVALYAYGVSAEAYAK